MAIRIYSLLFFLMICLLPRTSHGWDMYCWSEWTKFIFNNGLSNVYQSWTDYLPLYHYILFLFGAFQGSIEQIEKYMYLIKAITLVFDFAGVIVVYKILTERIENKQTALLMSLFVLLNVAYLYDTLFWGQVDAIMTTFVFLAFYFALKKKMTLVVIFSILSINMKLQAIVFLPFLFLIVLPEIIKSFSFKKIVLWILLTCLLQGMIILPFYLEGDLDRLWAVVVGSMGKYPVISLNAYNIWYWFIEENHRNTEDSLVWSGISCNKWGLLMFVVVYAIILFPLLKNTFNRIVKNQPEVISWEKLLLTGALIPIAFFFFNTQMHERYCHPALIFIGTYALLSGNYFPYIFFSITFFLNIEDVLRFFNMQNYHTLIFNEKFIACLYLVSILVMLAHLYDIRFRKPGKA